MNKSTVDSLNNHYKKEYNEVIKKLNYHKSEVELLTERKKKLQEMIEYFERLKSNNP